jgi:hypothetical protein
VKTNISGYFWLDKPSSYPSLLVKIEKKENKNKARASAHILRQNKIVTSTAKPNEKFLFKK